MLYRILIKDRNGCRFLAVSFLELLDSIANYNKDYCWSIYELDASVKPGGIVGYSDLIDKIDSSDAGYCIAWNKLKDLAEGLAQVVNLVLVASDEKTNFSPYANTSKWREKYKMAIELLDGDYWEVYSFDKKLIDYLEAKYKITEVSVVN